MEDWIDFTPLRTRSAWMKPVGKIGRNPPVGFISIIHEISSNSFRSGLSSRYRHLPAELKDLHALFARRFFSLSLSLSAFPSNFSSIQHTPRIRSPSPKGRAFLPDFRSLVNVGINLNEVWTSFSGKFYSLSSFFYVIFAQFPWQSIEIVPL